MGWLFYWGGSGSGSGCEKRDEMGASGTVKRLRWILNVAVK